MVHYGLLIVISLVVQEESNRSRYQTLRINGAVGRRLPLQSKVICCVRLPIDTLGDLTVISMNLILIHLSSIGSHSHHFAVLSTGNGWRHATRPSGRKLFSPAIFGNFIRWMLMAAIFEFGAAVVISLDWQFLPVK